MDRKKCRPGSDFESHPPPLFPAHLHQPLPGSHPRRLVVAAEHVHRDDGRIVLAVRQDALARLALELRVQALDCVGGADRLPDRPGEGIVREVKCTPNLNIISPTKEQGLSTGCRYALRYFSKVAPLLFKILLH